jgi:hypothetical protein
VFLNSEPRSKGRRDARFSKPRVLSRRPEGLPYRRVSMMPPLFSLENLYRQYLRCRRQKRNTHNAFRFEVKLEENLVQLHEELEGRTYHPSRSVCFVVKQPKFREINELDQFVKHQLKARQYLRYSDDFVLVHKDPAQLLAWREAIQAFLAERLRLSLTDPLASPRLACWHDFATNHHESCGRARRGGLIWFIWSIWFNQTNETDQMNKRDQPVLALLATWSSMSLSGSVWCGSD